MAELNETPSGNRVRIAFFGARNAGKSTLVNAFTGQQLAIVSEVAGTTTDPVTKAMEILPLGPCLITDTAGLDDVGELGALRVKKTLAVLAATDVAVWVASEGDEALRRRFGEVCAANRVTVLEYHRGEDVAGLRGRIAALALSERLPSLLEGLVTAGERVLCIVPIDESAPKGRLILPQQQVIRECLERGATCTVVRPQELAQLLRSPLSYNLAITDSQAFGEVKRIFAAVDNPPKLTSFSVLFARQKGDIIEFRKGLERLAELKDGDTVMIAEGCTHHRQCNDIGSVKIPKALERLTGKKLNFTFASGGDFTASGAALAVHCGGCMLTRREMLRRIALAREAQVPIVNYGMVLAAANGLKPEDIGA